MVNKNLFGFFVLLLLTSCLSLYSSKEHYYDIDRFILEGDYDSALELLSDSKEKYYSEKDAVLYYLEEGMLHHYAGNYTQSNNSLSLAELQIEENFQKEVSKIILSGVLNDNALNYSGEDYEDIYINIFKSLNYLHLDDFEAAMVEVRRVNDKIKFLENRYADQIHELNSQEGTDIPSKNFTFYNNAFARYLGVLGYRSEGAIDSARIELDGYHRAFEEQPQVYTFIPAGAPALDSSSTLLNIISLSGSSPEKVPDTVVVNTRSNFVYLNIDGDRDYMGFNSFESRRYRDGLHLKFQFPRLEQRYDPVKYVEVYIDQKFYGVLDYLESVGNIAEETFKVKQPLIVGKTVTRALSKAVVSEATENLVEKELGSGFGILADILGSIYMEVSENSDLRIARYLPGSIWSSEYVISPGVYDIELRYLNDRDQIISREVFAGYEVKKDQLNLLESFYIGGL